MSRHEIELTDADDRFLAEEVGRGRYGNEAEVIGVALALLRNHDFGDDDPRWLAYVHDAIDEADVDIAAGRSVLLKDSVEIDEYMEGILKRALATDPTPA